MTLQSKPIFYQDPTCQESYEDPLILLYPIHNDPLPSQENSVLPSPIQHLPPKQDHYISCIPSNDPLLSQDQGIPPYPHHDPNPPHELVTPNQASLEPLIKWDSPLSPDPVYFMILSFLSYHIPLKMDSHLISKITSIPLIKGFVKKCIIKAKG